MEEAECLISAEQLILGQGETRRNCPICVYLNVDSLIHVLIFLQFHLKASFEDFLSVVIIFFFSFE